jgi:hypothetical protein
MAGAQLSNVQSRVRTFTSKVDIWLLIEMHSKPSALRLVWLLGSLVSM